MQGLVVFMAEAATPTANPGQQKVAARSPRYVCLNPDGSCDAKSGNCSDQVGVYPNNRSPSDTASLSDESSEYRLCRPLQTSTPNQPRSSALESTPACNAGRANSSSSSFPECTGTNETGSDTQHCNDILEQVQVPIVGYETLEERAKFTVFKLEVRKNAYETWYIFRRYSDFERLRRQLHQSFPNLQLVLPVKKWFGDNFEMAFLDERKAGLQTFVNSILSNKEVKYSTIVRQFFCFDEPPGPYDSMEESRAMCESLEDQVYKLTTQLQEKGEKCRQLESELTLLNEKLTKMEISARSNPTVCSQPKISQLDSNENLAPEAEMPRSS